MDSLDVNIRTKDKDSLIGDSGGLGFEWGSSDVDGSRDLGILFGHQIVFFSPLDMLNLRTPGMQSFV